jgi:hypothetical protein
MFLKKKKTPQRYHNLLNLLCRLGFWKGTSFHKRYQRGSTEVPLQTLQALRNEREKGEVLGTCWVPLEKKRYPSKVPLFKGIPND